MVRDEPWHADPECKLDDQNQELEIDRAQCRRQHEQDALVRMVAMRDAGECDVMDICRPRAGGCRSRREAISGRPSRVLYAEPTSAATNDPVHELQEQVRALQAAVAAMRSDWQQARAETAEMRRELAEIRTKGFAPAPSRRMLCSGMQWRNRRRPHRGQKQVAHRTSWPTSYRMACCKMTNRIRQKITKRANMPPAWTRNINC